MTAFETGEHVTRVLRHEAPDGSAVEALRVDYAPGGFTPGAHHHPPGAHVYVIEGSVLFAIDGEAAVTLTAGDAFYEPPGAIHTVSRNASDDLPASLIAFFVLGEGQVPLVEEAGR